MTDAAEIRRAAWLLLAMLAAGCSSSDDPARGSHPPPDDPPPDPACAPEQMLPGGTCVAAGVPAAACAEGFEADDQQGCTPILPAGACPDAQLAIPGEAACHEVAPCPDAPYGDAPIEAGTQFVDGAYGGADSDGSMEHPWTTLGAAITAADDGAVVAIAAGSYEGGWSQGKSIRLWGRCPAMTEIAGTKPGYAAVELSKGDAAEIHDLSITGVSFGVYAYKAKGVVLDRVYIHDTGLDGVLAASDLGAVEITLRRSLVERASSYGVNGVGATLTIEDSVVRGTRDIGADLGYGVSGQAGSILTVKRSISSGGFLGISARRSQATLEGVVVRDTTWAIANARDEEGASTMTLQGSVVERYAQYGVYNDSVLNMTGMVFRDAVQLPDDTIPFGIAFNGGSSGGCQGCLVERGVAGVTARGATVTLGGLAVRDMTRLGVTVIEASTADIQGSMFERTGAVAVFVADSKATVRDIIIRDTAAVDGLYGDGLTSLTGDVDASSVRIEGNERCAVSSFGGKVRLGDAMLECNAIDLDGEVVGDAPFAFEEGDGPNTCGCAGQERDCQVVSLSLAPPSIEGITD